jgi:aspartate carbamoyltransferase regulatory subunit
MTRKRKYKKTYDTEPLRQCFNANGTRKAALTKQEAEVLADDQGTNAYKCDYCGAHHTGNSQRRAG